MSTLVSPLRALQIAYCVVSFIRLSTLFAQLAAPACHWAFASTLGTTLAALRPPVPCSLRPGLGSTFPRCADSFPADSVFSPSDLHTVNLSKAQTDSVQSLFGRSFSSRLERESTPSPGCSRTPPTAVTVSVPVPCALESLSFRRHPEYLPYSRACRRCRFSRPGEEAVHPVGGWRGSACSSRSLPSRWLWLWDSWAFPTKVWKPKLPETPGLSHCMGAFFVHVWHRYQVPGLRSAHQQLPARRWSSLLRGSGHFCVGQKVSCESAELGPCGRPSIRASRFDRPFLSSVSLLLPVISLPGVRQTPAFAGVNWFLRRSFWGSRTRDPPVAAHLFLTPLEVAPAGRWNQSTSTAVVYPKLLALRTASVSDYTPKSKTHGAPRDQHSSTSPRLAGRRSAHDLPKTSTCLAYSGAAEYPLGKGQHPIHSTSSADPCVLLDLTSSLPGRTASFHGRGAKGESRPSLQPGFRGLEFTSKEIPHPAPRASDVRGDESVWEDHPVPLSRFLTRPLCSLRGISGIRSQTLACQANVSSCFDLLLFLPLKYVEIQTRGSHELPTGTGSDRRAAECKEVADCTPRLGDLECERDSLREKKRDEGSQCVQLSTQACPARETQTLSSTGALRLASLQTSEGVSFSPHSPAGRSPETETGPRDLGMKSYLEKAAEQQVAQQISVHSSQQAVSTPPRDRTRSSSAKEAKSTREALDEQQQLLREQLRVSLLGYLEARDGDEECSGARRQSAREKHGKELSAGPEGAPIISKPKERESWTGGDTAIVGCIEKV